MADDAPTVTVIVEFRWWLALYLSTLAFLARLFGCDIDQERVGNFISRYGLKYRIEKDAGHA